MLGLSLLAAVIRLPTLAHQSFWLDEGYTVNLVRMSFGAMLRAIPRTESTPPLYYAAAWVWARVFGFSEFGLRSLSAVAGIATIPVAYALARRTGGRRAGIIAGALLAVAPLMVWYSQEARAYALATLLATVSVLCVAGWEQERAPGWLAGWAVSAALGVASHYFVAFIVAGEMLVLWWGGVRGADRRLTGATALVLIVCAALVPLAVAQRGTGHADYIAQGSLATRIAQVPKQLLVGYASPAQAVTTVIVALLVLTGAVWPLVRSRSLQRRAVLPLATGLLCVLAPILLALVGIDFLDTRNLLPALPLLTVGAAIGFGASSPTGGRTRPTCAALAAAAAAAVIMLAIVVLVDLNPAYQRDNWRGAARALGPATTTRAIVISPGSGLIPLGVYLPGLRALSGPTAVRELDVVAVPLQQPGAGLGAPPRPVSALPVPAGFRPVGAVAGRTYTVLRFRASVPTLVSAPSLASDHLGTAVPADGLQPARG